MADFERSPFSDFINSLDLSGFSGRQRELPKTSETTHTGYTLIETEQEKDFTYDIEVGLAHFMTKIKTDMKDASVWLNYPSRVREFQEDDMLRTVTCMLDAAYPKRNFTPHVRIHVGEREETFDLGNYWEGKIYEKALQQPLTTLAYYVPGSAFRLPIPVSHATLPPFMFGFHRAENGEVNEFVKMSHLKGKSLDQEFAQEVIVRNRGYQGRDVQDDGKTLKKTIQELCTKHPQQTVGFM